MVIVLVRKDGTCEIPQTDDLYESIALEKKKSGNNYVGAYDFIVFRIDGKEYPLASKLSYEQVWHMYDSPENPDKREFTHGSNINDGPWELRKFRRIALLIGVSRFGRGLDMTVGHKDLEMQQALAYDYALHMLTMLYMQMYKLKNTPVIFMRQMLDIVKGTISKYPESDFSSFEEIVSSIEKDLSH